jgi:hypothetical protein
MSSIRARIARLVRQQQRDGGPFFEIFLKGGFSLSGEIVRASVCRYVDDCPLGESNCFDLERCEGENENDFMQRVRSQCLAHDKWIVWNPMPEPDEEDPNGPMTIEEPVPDEDGPVIDGEAELNHGGLRDHS